MYNYIKGEIAKHENGILTIEAGGIGYEIAASFDCYNNCKDKIYTYLNIKEDSHTLFGFAAPDEKKLFLQLLTVSGVGPKSALNLLSNGYDYLYKGIADGNINIKGVSKKTADKVILELSGKLPASNTEIQDAIAALINLGLPRAVAYERIKKIDTSGLDAETIIRAVLAK